jgi:uncharacterized protein with PIN domain
VQALTEVDLDIPAGQVTALAGDNGAGKSVLIKTISGNHLVERAGREDRVLLSRDRGLLMRKALRRAAFVRGQHPDAQLADFIERFRPPLQPWSLCLACGGTLGPVSKAQVANQLEPGTLRTQQRFSRCRSCGHVYWHGAHDAKLQQVVRHYT